MAKTKGLPGVERAVFVSGFVARRLSAGTSVVPVYPHTLGKNVIYTQRTRQIIIKTINLYFKC